MKKSVTVNVPPGKKSMNNAFCRLLFYWQRIVLIFIYVCTGVDNDNTIRVPGEGGVSAKSPRAGDVYVTLKVSSLL